jgi:hypothetical protein
MITVMQTMNWSWSSFLAKLYMFQLNNLINEELKFRNCYYLELNFKKYLLYSVYHWSISCADTFFVLKFPIRDAIYSFTLTYAILLQHKNLFSLETFQHIWLFEKKNQMKPNPTNSDVQKCFSKKYNRDMDKQRIQNNL